jgi:hypothetical protein
MRGRPARFHNATCRQRARRARLASRHHDVLTAIAELEAATRQLRHVVLSGGDTSEATRRLARASVAVHELLPNAAPSGVPTPPARRPAPRTPTASPHAYQPPTPSSLAR